MVVKKEMTVTEDLVDVPGYSSSLTSSEALFEGFDFAVLGNANGMAACFFKN